MSGKKVPVCAKLEFFTKDGLKYGYLTLDGKSLALVPEETAGNPPKEDCKLTAVFSLVTDE